MKDTRELNKDELNNISGGVQESCVDWDAIISRLTYPCPRCDHRLPLNKSIQIIDATPDRLFFDTYCCGKTGRILPNGEVKFLT
ncbi:MAG: bacteriocin [Clostridiales bacterium]|nr:bacteriocin [Clostridiales bacterium]